MSAVREMKRRNPAAGHSKKFSDDQWESLVNAFREHPGKTRLVSEITGIKFARCVRAWHHGYPHQGRIAVSQLLDNDKILARAQREAAFEDAGADVDDDAVAGPAVVPDPPGGPDDEKRAEVISAEHKRNLDAMLQRDKIRQQALADSARTRAEEGRLIGISRRNVMSLSVVTARVLRGAEELSKRVEEQLHRTDISVKDAMALMQRASVMVRLGTEAGKMAVQMERLAMGQPIGEGADVPSDKLSPSDAEKWIQMTVRALEKSKQRRRELEDETQRDSYDDDDQPSGGVAPRQLTPGGGSELGDRLGGGGRSGAPVGRPVDEYN